MNEEQITEEEIQELTEEERLKQMEEQMDLNDEYDAPQPEEHFNQHTFLHEAAFRSGDTLKTTFLEKWELGKPAFSVRFLLDMETLARFYLDAMLKKYKLDNRVAEYFRSKVNNITDSGMSSDGFVMNLNVTAKKDISRKKVNPIENLKGGQSKK